MPELPEVETIKTAICNSIGNCSINNLIVNNYRLRVAVPEDICSKVCGAKIINYRRIAKYILIDLDNGFSIIWHMGMSGKIKIFDETPKVFEKHDHIVLETDNGCVVYNDARRFGLFTCLKTSELKKHKFFRSLGPEPLSKDCSAEYLYAELQEKKVPIKVALLDQEVIVGIGNIYASESLFCAGISPLRSANSLSFEETKKLLIEIRKVLQNHRHALDHCRSFFASPIPRAADTWRCSEPRHTDACGCLQCLQCSQCSQCSQCFECLQCSECL